MAGMSSVIPFSSNPSNMLANACSATMDLARSLSLNEASLEVTKSSFACAENTVHLQLVNLALY